jgi:hypothetical protein
LQQATLTSHNAFGILQTKMFYTILVPLNFVLHNFYFVYLFSVAIYRLSLELKKCSVHSSPGLTTLEQKSLAPRAQIKHTFIDINLWTRCLQYGAMTFGIMILSIMTLGITILSITAPIIATFVITTYST